MKFEMRNLIMRFEHLVEGARLKYSRASCLHYEMGAYLMSQSLGAVKSLRPSL